MDRFIKENRADVGKSSLKLVRDGGYALINYTNCSSAKKACSILDGIKMRSGRISVKFKGDTQKQEQHSSYAVKINGVSSSVSEEELQSICSRHGNLTSIKMNPGYAYANFSSLESAQSAIQYLNRLELGGVKVKAKLKDQGDQTQVSRTSESWVFMVEQGTNNVRRNPQPPPHSSMYVQSHPYSPRGMNPQSFRQLRMAEYHSARQPFLDSRVPNSHCQPLNMHPQPTTQLSFKPTQACSTATVKVEIEGNGVTGEDLLAYFSGFGKVLSKPVVHQGSPNYAYINYESVDNASKACKNRLVKLKDVELKVKPSMKQCVQEVDTKSFKSEDVVIDQLLARQRLAEIKQKLVSFDVTVTPLHLTMGGLRITGNVADVVKAEVVVDSEVSILQSEVINKDEEFNCSAIPHFSDPNLFQSIEHKHSCQLSILKGGLHTENLVQFSALVAASLDKKSLMSAALFDDYFSTSNAVSTKVPTWLFQDDTAVYTEMSSENSSAVEKLYQTHKLYPHKQAGDFTHTMGKWVYSYDFTLRQQKNTLTYKTRSIQRTLKESAEQNSRNIMGQCRGLKTEVNTSLQELNRVIDENSCTVELKVGKEHQEEILKLANQFCVQVADGNLPGWIALKGCRGYVDQVKLELKAKILDAATPVLSLTSKAKGPHWEPQIEKVELKTVRQATSEWQVIQDKLRRSIPNATILRLQRIQNESLWERFAFCRQRMMKKNGPEGVNEKKLFHGPGQTRPESIYCSEYGFDFRFGNAGMWGKGTYFASDASYSSKYAHTSDQAHNQMFLAFVLTGLSTAQPPDSSLDKPPLKPGSSEDRYDSVNGLSGSTKIYIVYDHDKSYPAYLITFRKGNTYSYF